MGGFGPLERASEGPWRKPGGEEGETSEEAGREGSRLAGRAESRLAGVRMGLNPPARLVVYCHCRCCLNESTGHGSGVFAHSLALFMPALLASAHRSAIVARCYRSSRMG